MSWTWFGQSVLTQPGAVHGCYIANYDSVRYEFNLLRARTSGSTEIFDDDSAKDDANDKVLL